MNYDAYEGSMKEHGMVWHGDYIYKPALVLHAYLLMSRGLYIV